MCILQLALDRRHGVNMAAYPRGLRKQFDSEPKAYSFEPSSAHACLFLWGFWNSQTHCLSSGMLLHPRILPQGIPPKQQWPLWKQVPQNISLGNGFSFPVMGWPLAVPIPATEGWFEEGGGSSCARTLASIFSNKHNQPFSGSLPLPSSSLLPFSFASLQAPSGSSSSPCPQDQPGMS